jgi:hypothetical protein
LLRRRVEDERLHQGLSLVFCDHLYDGCRIGGSMSDIDYAYIVASKIVDREMACSDDHWNDEYGTRPDSAWHTGFHQEADVIEFSGRPYQNDKDAWVRAYLEAEAEVIELRAGGHARARAILDLPYEMAFTCDDCRLWAFVGHRDTRDTFSEEERHGPLFEVRRCDPDAVRKIHGKPFDPNGAWDRERIIYEQEVSGSDNRRKRDHSKYNAKRKAEYAAKKEAQRAATTEKR